MTDDGAPLPPAAAPLVPAGAGTAGMDPDHVTVTTRDPEETAARLEAWLADMVEGDQPPVITEVSSPGSTGMSSETVLFTVTRPGGGAGEQKLVARVEPPATAYPLFTTYDLDMQFKVMRLVEEHTSVPVPHTLWYEPDPSVLGGPFFVMEQVDGLVPPDVLPYTFGDNWLFDADPADRRRFQASVVGAVAGIHSLTPERVDLDFLTPTRSVATDTASSPTSLQLLVRQWKEYAAWVVQDTPSPLLAECFDWLEERTPTGVGADALSWGDGRIGNMMFKEFEVVAVLDWEMASVAPPEVDLGWLCYLHLFFHDIATDLGAPGLPDLFRPVDVAEAYGTLTGRAPADLAWFIAFAAVRHGAIMRRVTERAIFFGEAARPDDIDDLIIHRATLRGMLDGSYWDTLAL